MLLFLNIYETQRPAYAADVEQVSVTVSVL
jgi:hypothetical protein